MWPWTGEIFESKTVKLWFKICILRIRTVFPACLKGAHNVWHHLAIASMHMLLQILSHLVHMQSAIDQGARLSVYALRIALASVRVFKIYFKLHSLITFYLLTRCAKAGYFWLADLSWFTCCWHFCGTLPRLISGVRQHEFTSCQKIFHSIFIHNGRTIEFTYEIVKIRRRWTIVGGMGVAQQQRQLHINI